MATKELILSQALALNEADRLELAERLFDSLHGLADAGVKQAWADEIARRLDDHAAGRARFSTWEDARRRITGDAGAASG